MCWAEKCCYFIPLNMACVLLGIINFITSIGLIVASFVVYFTEEGRNDVAPLTKERPQISEFLGLELKMETINIMLSIVVIVCMFWMVFSVLLVVGIVKNQPSLILSYFSFSIFLTILGQLSGLLFLLNCCWWMAFIFFIASTINIHFVVVVHTVYELMQKGTLFRFRRFVDDDEDPLADCFDERIDI